MILANPFETFDLFEVFQKILRTEANLELSREETFGLMSDVWILMIKNKIGRKEAFQIILKQRYDKKFSDKMEKFLDESDVEKS